MDAIGTHGSALRREPVRARALVVDDDDDMRRAMAMALARVGFEVDEACDGEDVVAAFGGGREPPDVVVSDVEMARLSGIDALQEVRLDGVEAPFVLVTARDDEETRARAETLGARAVLEKPVDLGALRRLVLQIVGR